MELIDAWHVFLETRGTCYVDAEGHIRVTRHGSQDRNILADDARERLEAAGFGRGGDEWRRFVREVILEKEPEPMPSASADERNVSAFAEEFFSTASPASTSPIGEPAVDFTLTDEPSAGIFSSASRGATEGKTPARTDRPISIIDDFF